MNKLITYEEAANLVRNGDTIMVGGFLAVGTPEKLIDALIAKGLQELTLICNDTGFVDRGVGKMVVAKMFTKIMASHIGTNRETGRQFLEGETAELAHHAGDQLVGSKRERMPLGPGRAVGAHLDTQEAVGVQAQSGRAQVDQRVHGIAQHEAHARACLLYTSPSPRDS